MLGVKQTHYKSDQRHDMCHIIVMSSQKVSGEASLKCLHMDMHKSMRPKKIIRNMEHTAVLHAESQTQDS